MRCASATQSVEQGIELDGRSGTWRSDVAGLAAPTRLQADTQLQRRAILPEASGGHVRSPCGAAPGCVCKLRGNIKQWQHRRQDRGCERCDAPVGTRRTLAQPVQRVCRMYAAAAEAQPRSSLPSRLLLLRFPHAPPSRCLHVLPAACPCAQTDMTSPLAEAGARSDRCQSPPLIANSARAAPIAATHLQPRHPFSPVYQALVDCRHPGPTLIPPGSHPPDPRRKDCRPAHRAGRHPACTARD